ncbi:MAG: hypothetical protein C5B46_04580 [Proteobacteria bacterium]|nr:MAG: hypothetical protein C5B46_04580 [Pseudomonadota bacterium]
MNTRRWSLVAFAVSLLALSLLAFHSKSSLLFFRFDGTYLLVTAITQSIWTTDAWSIGINPLQGIGGMDVPWRALLDPGLWLAAHVPAPTGQIVAMTLYAAELAVAIVWLGTRLGLGLLASLAAAWLGLLLAFPYVYPSLGFEFLWGMPSYASLILQNTAIILLFLDLGRGPRAADTARFLAMAAVGTYQVIQYSTFAPMSLIMLVFFGAVAVIAAPSMRERLIKMAAAAVLASVILAVFGQLLVGMYGFTKPTFFWYEFYPRPGTVRDLSFFVADHSRWPAWVVYGLSLSGALYAAARGGAMVRPMARGFLAFVVAALGVVLLIDEGWKGPRIAYIDIFAYPFYCVFAAYAAASATAWLERRLGTFRLQEHAGVVALCALPWLVLIDYWPPPLERPLVRNLNPYVWPLAQTPISRFLAGELALQPGSLFRGRVASVAGSDLEAQWRSAPVINQHNYDVLNLFWSGNDHRLYGLWYYGIPTLLELNQFSSPFFHLVNARLLNAPGTMDLRSYESQSMVNDRIMALLGVRYLFSDKLLAGRTPVLSYRLLEGWDLHLYSVPDANLAGYAVTTVRHAASGREAIALLADETIDLRRTAVLTTSNELPPLVPVSRSRLAVERGGYRVEADSPGTSLLVLPIEYSHCLHADLTTSGAIPPRLLRVNLAMTGILFSGSVKGSLTLQYGVLSSGCRMEDWREADALKIAEARDWPVASSQPE